MSAEINKALVRRFLQAHAKGDLDTVDEMLAPNFVDHNLIPGEGPGREGYLRLFAEFHAAYMAKLPPYGFALGMIPPSRAGEIFEGLYRRATLFT